MLEIAPELRQIVMLGQNAVIELFRDDLRDQIEILVQIRHSLLVRAALHFKEDILFERPVGIDIVCHHKLGIITLTVYTFRSSLLPSIMPDQIRLTLTEHAPSILKCHRTQRLSIRHPDKPDMFM